MDFKHLFWAINIILQRPGKFLLFWLTGKLQYHTCLWILITRFSFLGRHSMTTCNLIRKSINDFLPDDLFWYNFYTWSYETVYRFPTQTIFFAYITYYMKPLHLYGHSPCTQWHWSDDRLSSHVVRTLNGNTQKHSAGYIPQEESNPAGDIGYGPFL